MIAQASVTEYLVLVFMIMLIAFITVILLFGFQMLGLGGRQLETSEKRVLFLLESFSASNALISPQYPKGSVFEDSKLTVATCESLMGLFGEGWYAEVRVLRDEAVCGSVQAWKRSQCVQEIRRQENTVCTKGNYPECSVWRFCGKADKMAYMTVPVNVYRKMNGTTEIAVLTMGYGG